MFAGLRDLVIRTDADVRTGIGHVMRCVALAQAWRRLGGRVTFACAHVPDSLRSRLLEQGFAVIPVVGPQGSRQDLIETRRLAERLGAESIVLDGYGFDAAYQRECRVPGARLLVVDDFGHAEPYSADVVLNQNLYADERLYVRRESSTRLLLGGAYVLLREEFLAWTAWHRETRNTARNVLVTCGGADEGNVTAKVLLALAQSSLENLRVTAVVGCANPHRQALATLARALPYPVWLAHQVNDMPGLMAWADLAVGSAGSTCWEMAFMGLPVVTLVLADNQVRVGEAIDANGLGENLGPAQSLAASQIADAVAGLAADPLRRRAMSRRGRRAIDGQGATRVARVLGRCPLQLRPATWDDCFQLWQWRNEPETRQASFSHHEIPYEHHAAWFRQKLDSDDCRLWVAEDVDGRPAGQVRFDISGQRAQISVIVDRRRRRAGLGTTLIRMATESIFQSQAVVAVSAMVKPDNRASCRAFEKAGYRRVEDVWVDGCQAHCYVAERPDFAVVPKPLHVFPSKPCCVPETPRPDSHQRQAETPHQSSTSHATTSY